MVLFLWQCLFSEAVTRYRQSKMESWRKVEAGTMGKHKQATRRAQRVKQVGTMTKSSISPMYNYTVQFNQN